MTFLRPLSGCRADWEAPSAGDCAAGLAAKCPFPYPGGVDACLACTRAHLSGCTPKQRNVYCDTNGTGLHADPASLCGENGAGQFMYGTFCNLPFTWTRFLPVSRSYHARTVMHHLFWAMTAAMLC